MVRIMGRLLCKLGWHKWHYKQARYFLKGKYETVIILRLCTRNECLIEEGYKELFRTWARLTFNKKTMRYGGYGD